jgi:hypothetical protein
VNNCIDGNAAAIIIDGADNVIDMIVEDSTLMYPMIHITLP